jgi:hypothetical protein
MNSQSLRLFLPATVQPKPVNREASFRFKSTKRNVNGVVVFYKLSVLLEYLDSFRVKKTKMLAAQAKLSLGLRDKQIEGGAASQPDSRAKSGVPIFGQLNLLFCFKGRKGKRTVFWFPEKGSSSNSVKEYICTKINWKILKGFRQKILIFSLSL